MSEGSDKKNLYPLLRRELLKSNPYIHGIQSQGHYTFSSFYAILGHVQKGKWHKFEKKMSKVQYLCHIIEVTRNMKENI